MLRINLIYMYKGTLVAVGLALAYYASSTGSHHDSNPHPAFHLSFYKYLV